MSVTIKLRGDTEANWQAANPVLADREVALSTDNLNFKVGDGSTAWTSLGYWLPENAIEFLSGVSLLSYDGSINIYIDGYNSGNDAAVIQFRDRSNTSNRSLLSRLFSTHTSIPDTFQIDHRVSGAYTSFMRFRNDGSIRFGPNYSEKIMIASDGSLNMVEITPPAAPAANNIRLYAKDNGSGKTQLCVKFSDGTETILATQP